MSGLAPRWRYELTVPATDNRGRSMLHLHRHVRDTLADLFDGSTRHQAIGDWRGCCEDVNVYIIDTPCPHAAWTELMALAQYVKGAANQDAVYLVRYPIEAQLV